MQDLSVGGTFVVTVFHNTRDNVNLESEQCMSCFHNLFIYSVSSGFSGRSRSRSLLFWPKVAKPNLRSDTVERLCACVYALL